MDDLIRELERRFRATGSHGDEEAWLAGRVRSGERLPWAAYERWVAHGADAGDERAAAYLGVLRSGGDLSEERLALAAYAGHPPARLLRGDLEPQPAGLSDWLLGIGRSSIPDSELSQAAGRLCVVLLATWIARHVAGGAALRPSLPGLWACWEFLPQAQVALEMDRLGFGERSGPPGGGPPEEDPEALDLRLRGLARDALVGGQTPQSATREVRRHAQVYPDLDLEPAVAVIKPLLARWALRMDPVRAWHTPWDL